MKIDVLESMLNDELSWRKQEIAGLNLIAFKIYNTSEKDHILYQTVMKTLFLLLYSHWEGFIKKTCKLYLVYLSSQSLIISKLTPNFNALILQRSIDNCTSPESQKSSSILHYLNFIESHEKRGNKKFRVDVDLSQDVDDGFIQTYSNLNFKHYKNLINSLNLPFYKYYFDDNKKVEIIDINGKPQKLEYLKNLLDFNLLMHRNSIAHGSATDADLDYTQYTILEKKILFLMSIHQEDIIEYCFNKFFLIEKNDNLNRHIDEQLVKVSSFFDNLDRNENLTIEEDMEVTAIIT